MPELSIIVVLYNSAGELGGCLQSVRRDVESGWAELILVDNASPDESVAIGVGAIPSARLLRMTENRGFAAGVNQALADANGRYCLLLNPDVVVPPGGLLKMVAWLDGHPGIGAASPDIVDCEGASEAPAHTFPSITRTLLESTRLHRLLPLRLRSRMMLATYWDGQETDRAGWVPGTAMFVRSEILARVGPLSEAMFMYGEDIEWCWRIRKAGFRIGVNPEVAFSHGGSTSSIRSWGELEKGRQMLAGIHAACKIMYGARHARVLAATMAGVLAMEARWPRRTVAHRARMGAVARDWLDLARSL